MELDNLTAQGRLVAAARILTGLDQRELGELAGVSGSTISNLENGQEVRRDTLSATKRELKRQGVTMVHDKTNRVLAIAVSYEQTDDDDDEE